MVTECLDALALHTSRVKLATPLSSHKNNQIVTILRSRPADPGPLASPTPIVSHGTVPCKKMMLSCI